MIWVFLLLTLASFVGLIGGLIKPTFSIRWGKKRTRGRVLLVYLPAILGFFILAGVSAPPLTPAELAAEQAAAQKAAVAAKAAEQKAAEQKAAEQKAAEQKAAAQKAAAQKAAEQKAAEQKAAAQKAAEQKAAEQKAAAQKAAAAQAAAVQAAKQAETNYITNAQSIPWDTLSRNPGQYTGSDVTFTGQVITIINDSFGNGETIQLAVTPDSLGGYTPDQSVLVQWIPSDPNANRILQNDLITVYGSFKGIQNYQTVLGASASAPQIKAKYINDRGQTSN